MSDSFETLYQRALQAAAEIIPRGGMHTYRATEHWPRFYSLGASTYSGPTYFMAIERLKNGNYKGYSVTWPPGRRSPQHAAQGSMTPPRPGETLGWNLIEPSEVPGAVLKKLQARIDR